MLSIRPGASVPAPTTHHSTDDRVRRRRLRRIALTAVLVGLGLLPIFLEVVAAFELHPADDKNAALLASRKTLDFGVRPVGTRTPVVSLAIANNSESDVRISKVAIAGADADDFTVVSSTCETLAPNAVCTIEARFAPRAVGARSARLVVSGGKSLEVALAGKGIDASERKRTRQSTRSYR